MNKNISESENFVMLWVNGNKYLVGRPLADAVNKEREALRARAERAEAALVMAIRLLETYGLPIPDDVRAMDAYRPGRGSQ